MSVSKQVREGPRGRDRPAGRVLAGQEGHESDWKRKPLQEAISEVARAERAEASARADRAGIVPIRTNFGRNGDAQLEAALAKVWAAGPRSKGLYIKIAKGLTCLTLEDVVALDWLSAEEIEAVAEELAAGKTFKQAMEES
jgi:hypothetical protein